MVTCDAVFVFTLRLKVNYEVLSADDLLVYPNPTSDLLNIEFLADIFGAAMLNYCILLSMLKHSAPI